MIRYHKDIIPYIPVLKPTTVIWKYMDFHKFQYLIERSALYFTRMDVLAHHDELTVSKRDAYNYRLPYTDLLEVCERDKKRYFINCWSICDKEDQYMWDNFVKKDGVAIKTTVGSLLKSETSHRTIYISPIQYIDYEISSIMPGPIQNVFWIAISKPKSYQNEKELRLFCDEESILSEHIDIPIDLNNLIQEVRVRSNSVSDSVISARRLLDNAGLKTINVSKSEYL